MEYIYEDPEHKARVSGRIRQMTSLGTPSRRTFGRWCRLLSRIIPSVRACPSGEKGFVSFITTTPGDFFIVSHLSEIIFTGMDYDGYESRGNTVRYYIRMDKEGTE